MIKGTYTCIPVTCLYTKLVGTGSTSTGVAYILKPSRQDTSKVFQVTIFINQKSNIILYEIYTPIKPVTFKIFNPQALIVWKQLILQ